MSASTNLTFTASNGVRVGFRCRYRETNHYNFLRRDGSIEELDQKDGKELEMWGSAAPADYALAFAEYEANEARKNAEWRVGFDAFVNGQTTKLPSLPR